MLDDLRNSSSFIDEEETPSESVEEVRNRPVRRSQNGTFLGLTAQQRFTLSLMLFMMVCVLGTLALYVTNSITLPF